MVAYSNNFSFSPFVAYTPGGGRFWLAGLARQNSYLTCLLGVGDDQCL